MSGNNGGKSKLHYVTLAIMFASFFTIGAQAKADDGVSKIIAKVDHIEAIRVIPMICSIPVEDDVAASKVP